MFSKESIPELREDDAGRDSEVDLTNDQARRLTWFWMLAPAGARGLRRKALDDSVASGEFLEFDATSSTFRVGPLQAQLLDLGERIAQFDLTMRGRTDDEWPGREMARLGAASRSGAIGGVTVSAITMRTLFVLRNQLWNILAETYSVGRFLSGIDQSLARAVIVPLFPPPSQESPENDREMTEAEVDQALATAGGPKPGV